MRNYSYILIVLGSLCASEALAACAAPNGTYAGVIDTTYYYLPNNGSYGWGIDSARQQIGSFQITYNAKNKTNPFGSIMRARVININSGTRGATDTTAQLPVTASSWDPTFCLGSITYTNLDGNPSTNYFSVTDSGNTISGLFYAPTSTGSFPFQSGLFRKI